jgi:DNA-3-methyladenine glycosylase II
MNEIWDQAVRDLRRTDAVLARLIDGCAQSRVRRREDPFAAIARAIVAQQISVPAATTVWARVTALCDPLAPHSLVQLSSESLRSCGLSRQKSAYLLDLAHHFVTGMIDPRRWDRLDDEEVITELTRVKGIGRWTAEMFLIFHLMRPDVLPVADVGLRRAVSRHYNAGRAVSEARLRRIARAWSPWRSVATWYLWRSLDAVPSS